MKHIHERQNLQAKGDTMYNKEQLCNKIREVFPDIGECGIDIDIDYDPKNKAYVVDLKKDNQRLKTYLEPEDADLCMNGKQCMSLGIEIAQLKNNVEAL
jgi:hypothetical protein